MERKNITQEQLAHSLGKSRSYITNLLRILKLDPEIQSALNQKTLSVGHAKIIAGLKKAEQQPMFEKIINHGLSVRQVEALSKPDVKKNKRETKALAARDPHLRDIEDTLRDYFKTKVIIKPVQGQKGTLSVDYYSYEDLEVILNKMGITL